MKIYMYKYLKLQISKFFDENLFHRIYFRENIFINEYYD